MSVIRPRASGLGPRPGTLSRIGPEPRGGRPSCVAVPPRGSATDWDESRTGPELVSRQRDAARPGRGSIEIVGFAGRHTRGFVWVWAIDRAVPPAVLGGGRGRHVSAWTTPPPGQGVEVPRRGGQWSRRHRGIRRRRTGPRATGPGCSVTTRQVAIGSPPIALIEQNREEEARGVSRPSAVHFFRRPAAGLRATWTLRMTRSSADAVEGVVAALADVGETWGRAAGSAWPMSGTVTAVERSMSGPGRRGQAPKGTGGMPRRRRQCGRGRLRNARGSGRTRVDPEMPTTQPGELKHLSTRRNRKQPRFPQ